MKEVDLPDPEENLGAQTLRQAAEKTGDAVGDDTSTSTILTHAMLCDGIRNAVAERMQSGQGTVGFDAAAGVYIDLIEAGIVDPTNVVRIALENAVSVASVLLLTEATMTILPEKDTPPTGAGGEMGL